MFSRLTKILWLFFIAGLIGLYLFIVSISNDWYGLYGGMPDLKQLENPKSELASELYSADGVLLGKYYRENRVPTPYDSISPNVIDALIATEDIRFHEHAGIDFKGSFAIIYYLAKGEKRGSSTITQQLAKNLFDTRRSKEFRGKLYDVKGLGTVISKLKEWMLSIHIERSYTKKEIITMYLNTVDFGSNAFGIKVAAKTFFGKEPQDINLQEAAVLVGLLKAPTYYNPKRNPENSLRRRNTVLAQMQKYDYLNQTEFDSIKALKIDLSGYDVESHTKGLATYFRTEVAKMLLKWTKDNGYDLYADGLKVYTTIDSRMQRYAEQAVEEHLKDYQKLFFKHWEGRNPWIDENYKELPGFLERAIKNTDRYRSLKAKFSSQEDSINYYLNKADSITVFSWESPNYKKDTVLSPMDSLKYYKHFLQAGMMSMDPYNGHIKAWVGGINKEFFKYDHVKVSSKRQPGSTFKPIIYAAAMEEKGFHPCFEVEDVPITINLPTGDIWTPKNSGSYSYQRVTLRSALAQSINTVAAFLINEIKPEYAIKYARNLGITSTLDTVPSLALGTSDVSVYELVGAYGTFINRGVWTEPIFVTRIEDKNGKLLHQFVPKQVEALDEETAYTMVYMLRGGAEERGGTSLKLRSRDFAKGNQIGGKTGTTSNYSDAWYMGITKDLVTGVWTGCEDRSVHFRSIKYGQGGRQALPIYGIYADKVYADESLGYTKGKFPEPVKELSVELDCSKYQNAYAQASDSTKLLLPPPKKDKGIW